MCGGVVSSEARGEPDCAGFAAMLGVLESSDGWQPFREGVLVRLKFPQCAAIHSLFCSSHEHTAHVRSSGRRT